jgi:hypothetical protein
MPFKFFPSTFFILALYIDNQIINLKNRNMEIQKVDFSDLEFQIQVVVEMIKYNLTSLWHNRSVIIKIKNPLKQRKQLELAFQLCKNHTFEDTQGMIDFLKKHRHHNYGSVGVQAASFQQDLDLVKSLIPDLENNYLEFKNKIVNLWEETGKSKGLSYEQFCDLIEIKEEA